MNIKLFTRRNLAAIFLWISCLIKCWAQFPIQREFQLYSTPMTVYTCFQDQDGFVWQCTDSGLFRFNGFEVNYVPVTGNISLTERVSIALPKDDGTFYLGTSKGLMHFEPISRRCNALVGDMDVRFIVRVGKNRLLLGTMNGLLVYDEQLQRTQAVKGMKGAVVYDVLRDINQNKIYISMGHGLYIYYPETDTIEPVEINLHKVINDIVQDSRDGSLWIGTDNGLYHTLSMGWQLEEVPALAYTVINNLMIAHDDNLWIATDNGLYIYNSEKSTCEHHPHRISNPWSLADNVVWHVFEDAQSNIWLSTNAGVSLYVSTPAFTHYRWNLLTGDESGNNISNMLADSKGRFWIGGANGLVMFAKDGSSSLFRMSRSNYYIPSNHIRCIFEDSKQEVWIGTDASIARYNETTGQFVEYLISDKTGKYQANWAFDIAEDNDGNFWISTFLSGVFIVNRSQLLSSSGHIVASRHLAKGNAAFELPDMIANKVCFDFQGNVWISLPDKGLLRMNRKTGNSKLFAPKGENTIIPHGYIRTIHIDNDGNIWVGIDDKIVRIDGETNEAKIIASKVPDYHLVWQIMEHKDRIIVVNGGQLLAVDKNTLEAKAIQLDNYYTCGTMVGRQLYLGGKDIAACIQTDLLPKELATLDLLLTGLMVDGKQVEVGKEADGHIILQQDLNHTEKITLPNDTKDITVLIQGRVIEKLMNSDLLEYRLEGYNDWQPLSSLPARLQFEDLTYGTYTLEVRLQADGRVLKKLEVKILTPWYATWWFRMLELLLLATAVYTFYYYTFGRIRRRQEELRRKQTLELASQKMEFLTNISHDLKTPLSLIMGLVTSLKAESRNSALKQKLEQLYQNTSRLSQMVHQILDYKDEEARRLELRLSRIDMIEFCRSMALTFSEEAERRNINIDVSTAAEKLYINGDAEKLDSIISNLLSNAVKYSADKSHIELRLKVRERDCVIEVQDHGVGISKSDQQLIFSRFYRSPEADRSGVEGSGIGLSIVKQLVEVHGGTIHLESSPGQGSLFRVILPKCVIITDADDLINSIDEQLPTILIVEDNDDISRFLVSSLSDYNCIIAHNGMAGFQQATEFRPHIIITDIMMPVMDGIEMVNRLKKHVDTATIPIIMLTAKDNHQTQERAISLGVDSFISKPFDVNLLKARIGQLIRRENERQSKQRQKELVNEVKEIQVKSLDEKFLEHVNKVIEEHISDSDLSVERLSELAGINAKQVYRKLKSLTGMTGVQYIRNMRLRKAALLLKQQRFTVAEVMYMVGFSNPSYFSKCFAELYGVTPSQYADNMTP